LDNRESALKGGDNGVDIVPGDSGKSPLVYYVARLVEDMEMPPAGKGDPLTPEQIGLLRAWIDQGAAWGSTNVLTEFAFSAAPTLRWITVTGNESKFREIEGIEEGFGGGLEHFSLEERTADRKFTAEGRVLFPENDIRVKLALEKTDFGFVRAGYEQWRRYYDDTGGYYRPFPVPAFDLNRDLYLDIGRAYIDFGLTLPNWPQMVLGYEYQFKEGDKSTLQWGPVEQNGEIKNIYPGYKDVGEQVHIAKFDLTHEFFAWRLEESARVEIYDLSTRRNNGEATLGPGADVLVRSAENATHVQGMNTLRVERQLTDWWLFSSGYLYSRLEGDSSFDQVTSGMLGPEATFWSSDQISLKRSSHIFSLANLWLPVEWLSASAGFQSEWTRQEGFGRVHLDEGDPNLPGAFTLYPATVESDLDKQKLGENVLIRFTKIPWTVVFAEARFDQESIGQYERDMPAPGIPPDHESTFLRDTDYFNDRRDMRAGFNVSPTRWMAFNTHYRFRISDSDYDTFRTNQISGLPIEGYPGFIRGRKIETDEVQAKLVLRPSTWLKTTLTYQLVATDYRTRTEAVPGGTSPESLEAGDYDAHIYGIQATVAPIPKLLVTATFNYSNTRTRTAQHGSPSVAPYEGDIYTLMGSVTYALNKAVDLNATYSFSQADYQQNNFEGLPLGLNYTRHGLMAGTNCRLSKNLISSLRYAFYQYDEPSTGGINDYTAHGVFATMTMKWQ
jgi:hypothetical protein